MQVSSNALTLTPDQPLLSDPDTTFPVYIDPVYKTVGESARLMVSSGGWQPGFHGDEGMGLCPSSYTSDCGAAHVKRLFYRMPTRVRREDDHLGGVPDRGEISPRCTTRTVQLWKTKTFGTSSTWNSTKDNWLERLDSVDTAKGCSAARPEM